MGFRGTMGPVQRWGPRNDGPPRNDGTPCNDGVRGTMGSARRWGSRVAMTSVRRRLRENEVTMAAQRRRRSGHQGRLTMQSPTIASKGGPPPGEGDHLRPLAPYRHGLHSVCSAYLSTVTRGCPAPRPGGRRGPEGCVRRAQSDDSAVKFSGVLEVRAGGRYLGTGFGPHVKRGVTWSQPSLCKVIASVSHKSWKKFS